MHIEARLAALGLVLPEPLKLPPGMRLPFSWIRIRGNKAYISGHGPQNVDGLCGHPLGKVGAEVSVEQAYQAARLTALAILASLQRELGDLESCDGLVESAWHGELSPALYSATSRHQWLLRSHPRTLRPKKRASTPAPLVGIAPYHSLCPSRLRQKLRFQYRPEQLRYAEIAFSIVTGIPFRIALPDNGSNPASSVSMLVLTPACSVAICSFTPGRV